MKFIADGMLGKLTRWLRILGHNVKYSNKLDDAELVMVAKKEDRILLTRDLGLYKQATAKGLDTFYLKGQTEEERLAELGKRFAIKLDVDMTVSRCPKCNTRVKSIQKEKVVGKIEKNTFNHYNEFWECPKCEQVYWQGAHWIKIRKMLKDAMENLKSETNNKKEKRRRHF